VHKLMMTSEERRTATRHRAVPSVARRTATALAVGTAGVLAAAVLGWFAAGEAGLTASAGDASAALLVPEPSSDSDWAEPAMRRTVDLTATPPPRVEPPAADPAPFESSAAPRPPAPAPEPEPEPSLPPVRPAVPTVQQGARCAAEGDTGVTRSGDPVVCTVSRGNGKPRWRHA
jgi:hypothetical protein